MNSYSVRMLFMQGYKRDDVMRNPNISLLARWTPLACGSCGVLGLWLRSPAYFWALGALTLVGSLSSYSFYDYLYQIFIRPFTSLGNMPHHGVPRRFGCAIGAALFVLSGTGFLLHYPLLALIPALVIIPLAFVAVFTQWCFASALYRLIFRKNTECC